MKDLKVHKVETDEVKTNEYRYYQNNIEVTAYIVHNRPLPHSVRFFEVIKVKK